MCAGGGFFGEAGVDLGAARLQATGEAESAEEDGGYDGHEDRVDGGRGHGEQGDLGGDEVDRGGEQDGRDDGRDQGPPGALGVGDAAEVDGYGDGGQQHQCHEADHAGGVHPEQQLLVRVGAGEGESEDDHRAEDGLDRKSVV